MKRALLLLAVLACGCRSPKAKPIPCDEVGSFDACKARPDCTAFHVDPGQDLRGPMWRCDPKEPR